MHIETLRQMGIEHVRYHQAIPADILNNVTAPLPVEWFTTATTTPSPQESRTNNAKLSTLQFPPELLQSLKNNGCPFECSGNGYCQNG